MKKVILGGSVLAVLAFAALTCENGKIQNSLAVSETKGINVSFADGSFKCYTPGDEVCWTLGGPTGGGVPAPGNNP